MKGLLAVSLASLVIVVLLGLAISSFQSGNLVTAFVGADPEQKSSPKVPVIESRQGMDSITSASVTEHQTE